MEFVLLENIVEGAILYPMRSHISTGSRCSGGLVGFSGVSFVYLLDQ